MNSLYQKCSLKNTLRTYFLAYRSVGFTKPAFEHYFLLLLATIVSPCIRSVRYLFTWFLSKWSDKSLNSYYYFLETSHKYLEKLEQVNLKLALSVVDEKAEDQPIFLVIDDTLQAKYGTHFENHQRLYDHAFHNGTQYLDGHCFVCLLVQVPLCIDEEIRYLSIPVACRQYVKGQTKLQLGADLIHQSMMSIPEKRAVILLCDSWYPRAQILETVQAFGNLDLISNVRRDTALYELPNKPTGKRGRPRKRGERFPLLEIETTFEDGDYQIGVKKCLTNLFDTPIYAIRTTSKNGEDRLFISTIAPENVGSAETDEVQEQALAPYRLYKNRWAIEVYFLEQKTFWDFGSYRVRSKASVEMYLHILSSAYTCIQLLPLLNPQFENLKNESIHSRKMLFSQRLMSEFFFAGFVQKAQSAINKTAFAKLWNALISNKTNESNFL